MPVVKTKENRVVADEPGPDDLFVRVTWHGPHEDGLHLRGFDGPLMPVDDYAEALAWAVSMADQMRFPLYVVPLTGADALADQRLSGAIKALGDQERGELRAFIITQLAQVMRDCDDTDVRADAYDVLVGMRVVRS